MLLSGARQIAAAYMDDIIGLDDFGIDVQYRDSCKRSFVVSVNDWTGREFSSFLPEKSFGEGDSLIVVVHDLIEALNVYAS